jgi:O-antigen ligase
LRRLIAPIEPGSTPWLELVCLLLFGLTPLVGYVGYLGFAPLVAAAGLLVAPTLVRARPGEGPVMLLAALCLWAAVSLTWSPAAPSPGPDGDYGGIEKLTAVKLVLELGLYGAAVAAFGRMSPVAARRAATALTIGLVPMAAIYVVDAAVQKGAIFRAIVAFAGDDLEPRLAFKNAAQTAYPLAMLLFPAVMVAVRRGWRGLAIGLGLALLIGTVVTDYTSPLLAFLIGGIAWFLVRRWGAVAARALIIPLVLGYLVAPFAVMGAVRSGLFAHLHKLAPLSWDIRLDVWAFATSKIAEHPLRGLGLDAARTFPGAIPLHTHDAPIQLWLELGLPGAALVAGFFAWILWRIGEMAHERRDQAAVAAATLVTYVVIGALSFGVWQEWWIAVGALALIFCRVERRGWNDAVKAWAQDDLAPLPR